MTPPPILRRPRGESFREQFQYGQVRAPVIFSGFRVEGLLDAYTNLQNPDFSKVAEAIGLWGRRVEKAEDLEGAVEEWLAHPGPALLDAVTSRFEPVMPPKIAPTMMFGTALYSVKAILSGRGDDVIDLVRDNLVK